MLQKIKGVSNKIQSYMRPIEQFLEIPLPDYQRKRTDICCTIFSVLFSVTLLCWAIVSFNQQHLMRANFPSDSQGAVCGLDHPNKPYLLFTDPDYPESRICVSRCPYNRGFAKCRPGAIQCMKSSEKIMRQEGRVGRVCAFQDRRVRRIIEYDADQNTRKTFFNASDSVIFAVTFSIGIGFIYLLLVQCLPRVMNYFAVFGGGVASIVLAVLMYQNFRQLLHSHKYALIALILFFGLAGIATIISGITRSVQMKINGVFLTHASLMVRQFWVSLLYFPIFLLAVGGLMILTLFELFAFWSRLPPEFSEDSLYWLLQSDQRMIIASILVAIQFIWGLNFIAQAYNFVIAGNGVDYYFGNYDPCRPFERLLCYHWGSVMAGSFVLGFLSFLDAFFDFFKPTSQNTWHARCCSNVFSCIYDFFDIVRHDAMGYINLTGLPYCNSARYCDFLSVNTPLFGGNQSISRLFRFSSHLLLTSIVMIIGVFYAGYTSLYSVIISVFLTYFVVEMFASLHANAAEGICVSFLAEEYLEQGDFLSVKRAPFGLVESLKQAVKIEY